MSAMMRYAQVQVSRINREKSQDSMNSRYCERKWRGGWGACGTAAHTAKLSKLTKRIES